MIVVTAGEQKTQGAKPFPKLMKSIGGHIFYFIREGYGLPLSGEGWDFNTTDSHFVNAWDMASFKDFNGLVTIKNK